MKYHIWTEGCQMNVADSQRVGSALEHLGYSHTEQIEAADVIVMNTCVVRQSAEDKAYGRLSSLKPLKQKNPALVINLMGCLVGVRGHEKLKATFPFPAALRAMATALRINLPASSCAIPEALNP